ncbi:MAG: S16 family serine protease [Acidimicrobiia bacterium]
MRFSKLVAMGALGALVLAGCGSTKSSSGGSGSGSAKSTASVAGGTAKVQALYFTKGAKGAEGGFTDVSLKLSKSEDNKARVSVSEDEVTGTGDQWRAAAWSALTVSTILTGAPLSGLELTVGVNGKIDGPSAGALMTTATLSLIKGTKLNPDVTMTGTINPDGTVGPVGGIPYKLDGVKKANKKTFLIPTGQRISKDDDGKDVDVVAEGSKQGITVKEVPDVYAAYQAFTGQTLAGPEASNPQLDEETYQKFKAKVTKYQGQYDKSVSEIGTINPAVLAAVGDSLTGLAEAADDAYAKSKNLAGDGQQAGAFIYAVQAAAAANAAAKSGKAYEQLAVNGTDQFISQVKTSAAIDSDVKSFVDTLATFKPKTVSDAGALIEAYGQAYRAIGLSAIGDEYFAAAKASNDDADTTADLITGAVYFELAGTLVQASSDLFDIGRDLDGAPLQQGVNVESVADFFRKAAEANFAAFNADIVDAEAQNAGVSTAVAQRRFAQIDQDYAFALSSIQTNRGLKEYFGNAQTYAYAQLGGSVGLYATTSGLLAKYYSLGEVELNNGTVEVTGVRSEKALAAAIDLAQKQLAGAITTLKSKQVNPALQAASFEVGKVQATGSDADVNSKLDSLSTFWGGFINSRTLTYLGGFPTAGLK